MGDEPREPKRYCVVVQLDKGAGIGRIRGVVPALVDLVKQWSKDEMEQLSRSNDGQLFSYLFKSAKPLAMMRAEFENSSATINADSVIIFEINEDFANVGFTRIGTWLQRH